MMGLACKKHGLGRVTPAEKDRLLRLYRITLPRQEGLRPLYSAPASSVSVTTLRTTLYSKTWSLP